MMNENTYKILKKAIASGILSPVDEIIAKENCQKYEEAKEAQRLKREIRSTMMCNMMYDVLAKAEKPLCPTEIQFILYRETGKEYSNATISWYCGQLWTEKKLSYSHKKNRTYYSIKKEN